LIGAGLGVSIAPACVRRIASAEVVCLPLRGAKAVSNVELAWLAGDARPIVERFKQIAESTRGMQ
jgi:DNA-binding transcriptional LysR family regulator